ncbi:dihydroneopterin aldolase [Thermomonas sp.]|uniref:dihydroneopterin aldolase n=1 Tax=Thermomonas sp. TaxID=1971895 RepID=UPI0035B1E9C4
MTDIVFIEGLRIDALIGVHDRERHAPQPLLLDIDMRFDNRIAASSDSLADALDYEAVSLRLAEYIAQTDFMLVETLAECCADLILAEFGAKGVRLKLRKPDALAHAAAVGVQIERGSFA